MNQYSQDQWHQFFEDAANSDLPIKKWCLANDVSFNAFCYHKYSKPYRKRSRVSECANEVNSPLVKLSLVDCVPTIRNDGFEIVIGKACIKVDDSTDLVTLAKLIRLLDED